MHLERQSLVDEPAVQVRGLSRSFGQVRALAEVSLDIGTGEFFCLLGPSGCGKTTLLRVLAGLDMPDAGTVSICGRDMRTVPAHERPVNTVFQSYALFPHLTVFENVAFGLRMKKVARNEIQTRVQRGLELVRVSHLVERRPAQLSGGEKQRVALARAVVNEPRLLLLDEPLGALDLKLRKELQLELHHLQRRLGITFLHVTHDQDEALAMSDRIAVMNVGKIQQIGSPREIYEQPQTRFVAQFIGACNLFEGKAVVSGPQSFHVNTALGKIVPARLTDDISNAAGVCIAVRPEKIQLSKAGTPDTPNQFSATLEDLTYNGAETQYHLRAGEQRVMATLLNSHAQADSLRVGENVCWSFPPAAACLLKSEPS